jgi:hypothetical protein
LPRSVPDARARDTEREREDKEVRKDTEFAEPAHMLAGVQQSLPEVSPFMWRGGRATYHLPFVLRAFIDASLVAE